MNLLQRIPAPVLIGIAFLLVVPAHGNAQTGPASSPYDGTFFSANGFTKVIKDGNFEYVKLFIKSGINVNLKTEDSMTPLMWAAITGYSHILKLLLISGAELENRNIQGYTALMWATRYGHTGIVTTLLDAGANLNIKEYRFGWTPLMLASHYGHVSMVRLLLKYRADPHETDKYDWNALALAKNNGQTEIARLLKQEGSEDWKCKTSILPDSLKTLCGAPLD
ncbi:ankyrin repeat domain-containing protein [Deltaproteobacteria bacterium TL4]